MSLAAFVDESARRIPVRFDGDVVILGGGSAVVSVTLAGVTATVVNESATSIVVVAATNLLINILRPDDAIVWQVRNLVDTFEQPPAF